MRIGIGYDAHKFIKGRALILGGVKIPYDFGLKGHSDADVLVHSIIDALLGACGLGDIGRWFPDSDKRYENIDSLKLLEKTRQMIVEKGYKIINTDSVIIAQEPKLQDYIELMRERVSQALLIEKTLVNIKATTTEGMGFEGKKEGIASKSVCLLEKEL